MKSPKQTNSVFYSLDIGGMTCASCVGRVEKALNKLPGVQAATVNLATEQAHIRVKTGSGPSISDVIATVQKAGYDAKISAPPGMQTITKSQSFWQADGLGRVLLSFALSAPLLLPMLLMPIGNHWSLSPDWQLALATPVQFVLGWRFYRAGFKSLLAGVGNMDLLVALGTSAAYGLSVYQMLAFPHQHHELYFEGSTVIICMVLLGKWLEARAKKQTSEAIRALQKLWPEHAKVLNADFNLDHQAATSDHYQDLPLDQVLPGDRVLVLPGERIPVDGVILSGSSHVDESLITGESEPIKKEFGAKLIGGALNGEGVLVVEARAVGTESVLSKIIFLVEDAQVQKAPIQKLVDYVSAIFVPAVIVIALITGLSNWFYYHSVAIAILRSVAVLVIACPCALGLATPAAIMAGTGVAARFGILIKDPQVLELAHRLNIVAFDKTGTLTIGKPRLLDLITFETSVDADFALMTAAGLQLGSEHPLAKALIDATKEKQLTPIKASQSKALPGVGIEGSPTAGPWSGVLLSLQSVASLEKNSAIAVIHEKVAPSFKEGQTISILMNVASSSPIAAFAFGDELKVNTGIAIQALKELGIRSVMLSGDNKSAAERVAHSIGIDVVFAQIMPSDKAQIIEKLKSSESTGKKQWVAMVGDGINDAPALAVADVGMAMSTGTDVAMQAAGITLMRGDPKLVADAIYISKKTWNKIRQNLFWAFIFNATGIPLAALGYLSPMLAGSAMALSSFCVLSNALLLKRWHPSN
jgi:P-type Cu+ transporter